MNSNDRANLIKRINTLEGLTDKERSALLGLLRENKTYGLVWEDKPEDVEERLRDELPILTEVPEYAITSEDKDAPNHILIEGDNLEALATLAYTHEGKIDVIYIDPPYNTGNKDFIYNDSYVDKEDSYRHSKWLSFMSRRLKIAKKLLSDHGVIFISIDDNEQAQLKLLCDEIFGADRFITNLIWQKKTGAADANGIAIITEYILVYCLDPQNAKNIFSYNKNAFDIKRYRYTDEFEKIRGPFYYDSLDRGSIQYSDGLNYGIEAPDGSMIFPNGRLSFVNDGWTWKWSKEKVEWGIKNKFIEIVPTNKKKNGWAVKYKIYLNVDNEGNAIEKSVPYKNLISGILNADAANDIKTIFNSKAFSYAKPIELIKLFINLIANKKGVILDFFAGSGTTLHATMQLNAEDGGHRQCILVTNNENNICEEVTYVRNKRVINGYKTVDLCSATSLTFTTTRDPTGPRCSSVCPSNCSSCDLSSLCTMCDSGYYLSSGSCESCPANATCDGSSSFTCKSGYWLQSGTCKSCPANATCDGSSSFTCKSGYKKSGNSCIKDRTVNSCPSRMKLSSDGCCCVNK